MQKKFNKYWIFILSVGFVFLISSTIIQYTRITNLSSRIDNINNNFQRLVVNDSTLTKELKTVQLKEDIYFKELDRNNSLILWFIAIVFGLYGILSFASFGRRVEMLEEDVNKEIKNHFSEINLLKENLLELEANLLTESASISSKQADEHLKNKEYEYFLFYSLLSNYKLAKYYQYHYQKGNKDLFDAIRNSIKTNLERIYSNIKNLDEKPKIDKKNFNLTSQEIRKINDNDINEILSKIHISIDYKENNKK